MKKRKVDLLIVVLVILVLSSIIFMSIIFLTDDSDSDKNIFQQVYGIITGADEKEEIGRQGEEDGELDNGGAGGVGGGGGGGEEGEGDSDSSTGDLNCVAQEITYAFLHPSKVENCIEYSDSEQTICSSRQVNCSIQIHNLDYTGRGNFDVELVFVPRGGSKLEDGFGNVVENLEINPRDYFVFNESIIIEGILAQEKIDCVFNSLNIPEKQVCS